MLSKAIETRIKDWREHQERFWKNSGFSDFESDNILGPSESFMRSQIENDLAEGMSEAIVAAKITIMGYQSCIY